MRFNHWGSVHEDREEKWEGDSRRSFVAILPSGVHGHIS